MNNKQFIGVVIVTFVVIVIWIVADILHTRPSVPLDPKLETLLAPISPNFDQKVISQIKEVTPVSELDPIQTQPIPSPIASPITPVIIPSEIPVATTGGTTTP